MTWPIVSDISNYDYDVDIARPTWDEEFIASGIAGIIVGSQWPTKATWQIAQARESGLRVVGTYAEPGVEAAIDLALAAGATRVGVACEPGGIITGPALDRAIGLIKDAALRTWLYGNRSDLLAIAGLDRLYRTDLDIWFANFGTNDPERPRSPITEVDFGRGPRKLIAHQFTSTTVVAGRNRDISYLYLEEDAMTDNDILAVFGSTEPEPAARLAAAKYRYQQAIETGHSPFDVAAQAMADAMTARGATEDEVRAVLARARIEVGP